MPKNTFYRLSEEKQNRILQAAREEFFRVSYSEASINKIIKNAEIPRGSFYQYFEDKQDLFHYVLKKQYDKILVSIDDTIKLAHGNIFEFIYIYLDEILENYKTGEGCFFKHSLEQEEMGHLISGMIQGDQVFKKVRQEIEATILPQINFSILSVENEKEKQCFIDILASVIKGGIHDMIHSSKENKLPDSAACLRERIMFLEKQCTR